MSRQEVIWSVLWAMVVNALCILPSFLVGSLASLIRAEYELSDLLAGVAFSAFWLVAALTAVPCSRLVKRWGPIRSLQVAGFVCALACVAIPLLSSSAPVLVALVAISGVATSLATPAVNVVIMSAVSFGRQAFAITAVGASPVLSLMAAGFAAHSIGVPFGWRGVFLLNGLLVVVLVVGALVLRVHGPAHPDDKAGNSGGDSLRPLVFMMVGVLAGNAAVGAATGFLVLGAPSAGVSPLDAALAVAVASAASILFRLTLATAVDRRRGDPMRLVIGLLLLGALGFGVLGFGTLGAGTGIAYYIGMALVLVPGWSWVSLLLYGVLARYRTDVAGASGVVQMVFFVGGVAGPGTMAVVLGLGSYAVAWWFLAGASLIAATSIAYGHRALPQFQVA